MNMDPDKWARAKELFQAALDLDPSQRTSFLAENCADGDLRQQVEKLLISYQEAGTFLDDPVLESSIARSRNSAPEIQAEEASRLPTKSVGLLTTATGRRPHDRTPPRRLQDCEANRTGWHGCRFSGGACGRRVSKGGGDQAHSAWTRYPGAATPISQ